MNQTKRIGFHEAKRRILKALAQGTYLHHSRGNIDEKNKLQSGEVSDAEVASIVKDSTGRDYSSSKFHGVSEIEVHVIRRSGWYVKFYFLDGNCFFMSVHRQGDTMKLRVEGEKARAVCEADGIVPVTFRRRDVPFATKRGIVRDILVGVCDKCGKVVVVPPQSTPAIREARDRADVAIEASLPAVFVDTLDLACHRIDASVSTEFRKRLLMYYLRQASMDESGRKKVARALDGARPELRRVPRGAARRRLSMKISRAMSLDLDRLAATTRMSKTRLIKSLVARIDKDIVAPDRPANLKELRILASVATC